VPASLDPPRKLWTREGCAVLVNAGLIEPEQYELVEGELIRRVDKKYPHGRAGGRLVRWLVGILGDRVLPEHSINVAPEDDPTSEPQPDVIVLTPSDSKYSSNPGPGDIRLVAEVSDSTLAFDLNTKSRLYARAGIPEYWVLDVKGRRLIMHRDPSEGRYRLVVAYGEEEMVTCVAPEAQVRVSDLL
jgi:Uma2 family endonuclease